MTAFRQFLFRVFGLSIVADLQRDGLAKPGREGVLRDELLAHFRVQLAHRTPDLFARAVGFRTQRQALASDLDLRAMARSFFVDLVQSTFAATYRTGVWPGRFRSIVGRELAVRIRKRCLAEGVEPSGDFALRLLEGTAPWEDEGVGFEKVTAEVNSLLGDADGGFLTMQKDTLNERFGIGRLTVGITQNLQTTLYEHGMIVSPPHDMSGTLRIYDVDTDP